MKKIGKYLIKEEIATGPFGVIYHAVDVKKNTEVALKLFQSSEPQNTKKSQENAALLLKQFLKEARNLRKLTKNPHIIDLIGFGETDDNIPWYAINYLHTDLRSKIGLDIVNRDLIAETKRHERPRSLPLEESLTLLIQLLDALSDFHREDLIHGDINPENILINEAGNIQLSAFGITKKSSGSLSPNATFNRYLAPEQRENHSHIDYRADIYSFAAIAYRIITGTLPVGRYKDPKYYQQDIDDQLNDLILDSLSEQPKERPYNSIELAIHLKKSLKNLSSKEKSKKEQKELINNNNNTAKEKKLPLIEKLAQKEEQAKNEYAAELQDLKNRIVKIFHDHGEIPHQEWNSLIPLGAINGLDKKGINLLIEEVKKEKHTEIFPIVQFVKRLDQLLVDHDLRLSDKDFNEYKKRAEAIAWDETKLRRIIRNRISILEPQLEKIKKNKRQKPENIQKTALTETKTDKISLFKKAKNAVAALNRNTKNFFGGFMKKKTSDDQNLEENGKKVTAKSRIKSGTKPAIKKEPIEKDHSLHKKEKKQDLKKDSPLKTDKKPIQPPPSDQKNNKNSDKKSDKGHKSNAPLYIAASIATFAILAVGTYQFMVPTQGDGDGITPPAQDITIAAVETPPSIEDKDGDEVPAGVNTEKKSIEKTSAQEEVVSEKEQSEWDKTLQNNTLYSYRKYLKEWPNGQFSGEAKTKIWRIGRYIAFKKAEKSKTKEAYKEFLSKYPAGSEPTVIRTKLYAMDDNDWETALTQHSEGAYIKYAENWPEGRHLEDLTSSLKIVRDDEAFKIARSTNSMAAFEQYLREFPNARHKGQVKLLNDRLIKKANAEQQAGDQKNFIIFAQIELKRLGYKNIGTSNGVVNPALTTALRHFERGTGLPVKGIITRDILFALRSGNKKPILIGDDFKDCENCPKMVAVPKGEFTMGNLIDSNIKEEFPAHKIIIPENFAVGQFEITRDQFGLFISAMNYEIEADCYVNAKGKWKGVSEMNWVNSGFSQSGSHPVTCVNINDALAYVSWLSRRTGEQYRLISEAEWEYVARAGSKAAYSYGSSEGNLCSYGNTADQGTSLPWKNPDCSDGFSMGTAPIGRFNRNKFGLYDIHGNLSELTRDCWGQDYADATNSSQPFLDGKETFETCRYHVARGGSWMSSAKDSRNSTRLKAPKSNKRYNYIGFRVARKLNDNTAEGQ